MAKISASYDSETGEFSVSVNGAEIPNVTSVNISAPPGYDNDDDDEYGPSIYCSISTTEMEGDLRKSTYYSVADEKSKADISNGLAKPSDIPGLIERLHLEQSIDNFLHGGR